MGLDMFKNPFFLMQLHEGFGSIETYREKN